MYLNVDYIRLEKNCGPAFAQNRGIELAQKRDNSYILFTDHDCILNHNWAFNMINFLQANHFEAVGGLTLAYGNTLIDKFHNLNGTLNGRFILPKREKLLYTPTCNFAISAKIARDFRFDTKYRKAAGEDIDFCIQINQEYSIGFCEFAVVWHDFGYKNSWSGIPKLTSMFRKYKEGNILLYKSHPEYLQNFWYKSEHIDARNYI